MKKTVILMIFLLISGCNKVTKEAFDAVRTNGHIICYSGNTKIFEGDSIGMIQGGGQNDEWFFKDSKTGKFTRISGSCVIQN